MSESYYDIAQICKNGHVISSMTMSSPESEQQFCDKCGAETIKACESCNAAIRGHYHVPSVIGFYEYNAPSYCYSCGAAYPWTEQSIQVASELADEFENLTDEEKEKLKSSLPELIKDGPKTILAETRFKKLIAKVGSDGYEAMKSILIDIVSETVKKSLFGV